MRLENIQTEDAIFNSYKATQKTREPTQALSADQTAVATTQQHPAREPTEVILYGYGHDQQWAAIEFYERISNGTVYEDYDRHPPHQRYDLSLSYNRATAQRSLSQAALKKRNRYLGGNHWIKVTFDSPEAADLACDRSPHSLYGHLVYAEPFRGTGPPNDEPIPYTNAGAQIDGDSLPRSFSTNTLSADETGSPSGSSNTMIGTDPASGQPAQRATGGTSNFNALNPFQSNGTSTALQEQSTPKQRPMRITGATRAVLLPADQAFLPAPPKYTSLIASWPLVGALFGNKADAGGSQIPRLEDGSFDWKNAGIYWRFFAWLDSLFGTDLCGLKGDD